MKPHLFFIPLVLILSGCANFSHSPPPPLTFPPDSPSKNVCSRIYPKGEWQFVHSISFTSKNANSAKVMGVTTLSDKTLSSALVTVEGLTLFAADFFSDNSYTVHRALPPFDAPHFAAGMMRDIRAIFVPPDGDPRYGQTAEGTPVCRYSDAEGRIIDVRQSKTTTKDDYQSDPRDDCWKIRRYTPDQTLELSITGSSCRDMESFQLPERLKLTAHGLSSYSLDLKLLSAERLE